jgi:hypothetical protein
VGYKIKQLRGIFRTGLIAPEDDLKSSTHGSWEHRTA